MTVPVDISWRNKHRLDHCRDAGQLLDDGPYLKILYPTKLAFVHE